MFELTINNAVYQFNFGIGFLKDIDPTVTKAADGVKGKVQNMGLQYAIGGVMDGNLLDIADVLLRANKGYEPRLTPKEVESWLDDADTNIDELCDTLLGFFESSNATRKMTLTLKEMVEREKAKQNG